MKNKYGIFTMAFIICIFVLGKSVHATTNSTYYDNQRINIGLESMEKSLLNITLNGDYIINGVSYKSGTSYNLKVNGTQIDFNGILYNNISFVPTQNTNTIKISSTYSRSYLGTVVFKINSGMILPINNIYIEDYLKGVVGYEMSDYFPADALKAQAIAARNYVLANINKHLAKGYNLCDTTDCQVYKGYDSSFINVLAAVDATKGMLLLSGSSIVEALYSASDGGYTEASENVWSSARGYFKSNIDGYDGYDPNYLWTREYTTKQMEVLLKERKYLLILEGDTFLGIDMSKTTKFDSGRIKNITLNLKDKANLNYTRAYGKDSARTFLSLPSALYDVSYSTATDTYSFVGKGIGHGVGMSQIGAKNRAKAKISFEDILKFYYTGTTIVRVLPVINSISVDKAIISSFDSPIFNVDATGGSGKGLYYEYIVKYNNNTLLDSGLISNSKFQYKPTNVGSYELVVYVKDSTSILPYEDSIIYNFNVKASVPEDVNSDQTVDIYDIVVVSKNIGKQKGVSVDWNDQWNVEYSDNVINISDVAKVAKKYNYNY